MVSLRGKKSLGHAQIGLLYPHPYHMWSSPPPGRTYGARMIRRLGSSGYKQGISLILHVNSK